MSIEEILRKEKIVKEKWKKERLLKGNFNNLKCPKCNDALILKEIMDNRFIAYCISCNFDYNSVYDLKNNVRTFNVD